MHTWDPYLAIGILLVALKELATLARAMYQRANGGNPGHGNPNGVKALWAEVNRLRDAVDRLYELVAELRERISRLEGRGRG